MSTMCACGAEMRMRKVHAPTGEEKMQFDFREHKVNCEMKQNRAIFEFIPMEAADLAEASPAPPPPTAPPVVDSKLVKYYSSFDEALKEQVASTLKKAEALGLPFTEIVLSEILLRFRIQDGVVKKDPNKKEPPHDG